MNISWGQVENEVQLVRGQVEKIQNSTPLILAFLCAVGLIDSGKQKVKSEYCQVQVWFKAQLKKKKKRIVTAMEV